MISVRVCDCVDLPELAVIVTCEVVVFFFEVVDESPHPENRPSPAAVMMSNNIIWRRVRFLNPTRHKATASVATGSSGCEFRLTAVAEPLMDNCELPVVPSGNPVPVAAVKAVMALGLKLHV